MRLSKVFCFFLVVLVSCGEHYTPKPRAYHRITLPETSYQSFSLQGCPVMFDHSTASIIVRDSLFFEDSLDDVCWFNIHYPELSADIHISYKAMAQGIELGALVEDSHKLINKHVIKAAYIEDQLIIKKEERAFGLLASIGGNAASPIQFYITDSLQHFLRGSLYFKTRPNIDSIAPSLEYVRKDILHLLETFQWKPAL